MSRASDGVQLLNRVVQPFYYSQYVELSQVCQGNIIEVDMFTANGAACTFEHTVLRTYWNNKRIGGSFYATAQLSDDGRKHVGVLV
jgi:hypothetical protein